MVGIFSCVGPWLGWVGLGSRFPCLFGVIIIRDLVLLL